MSIPNSMGKSGIRVHTLNLEFGKLITWNAYFMAKKYSQSEENTATLKQ